MISFTENILVYVCNYRITENKVKANPKVYLAKFTALHKSRFLSKQKL